MFVSFYGVILLGSIAGAVAGQDYSGALLKAIYDQDLDAVRRQVAEARANFSSVRLRELFYSALFAPLVNPPAGFTSGNSSAEYAVDRKLEILRQVEKLFGVPRQPMYLRRYQPFAYQTPDWQYTIDRVKSVDAELEFSNTASSSTAASSVELYLGAAESEGSSSTSDAESQRELDMFSFLPLHAVSEWNLPDELIRKFRESRTKSDSDRDSKFDLSAAISSSSVRCRLCFPGSRNVICMLSPCPRSPSNNRSNVARSSSSS